MKTRTYAINQLVLGPNANPYYIVGIGFRQFEVENMITKERETYDRETFTLWFN